MTEVTMILRGIFQVGGGGGGGGFQGQHLNWEICIRKSTFSLKGAGPDFQLQVFDEESKVVMAMEPPWDIGKVN